MSVLNNIEQWLQNQSSAFAQNARQLLKEIEDEHRALLTLRLVRPLTDCGAFAIRVHVVEATVAHNPAG